MSWWSESGVFKQQRHAKCAERGGARTGVENRCTSIHVVSPLLCVCHVFPPLVSIFGLFPVLVKCHYELILVQPCLSNYLWFTCVFIVLSVHFDLVWSTRYSPVFLSMSVMPCHALMSPLKTIILSLRPRLRVPVPPSCVHRDRRPDLTVSGARSLRFVLFVFWKVFICSCLSVPWQGSRHSSSRLSPLQDGVGVRRDRRESSGREPSCPPIAGDIRLRLWLSQARRLVA